MATNTATNTVWSNWTTTYCDVSSTTIIRQDCVWEAWVDNGTSATPDTYTDYFEDAQGTVWLQWTTQDINIAEESSPSKVIYFHNTAVKKSVEQRRAEKLQRQIDRMWSNLLVAEHEEEKKQSEITAVELLKEIISDVELENYKKHGELLVRGRNHDYLVKKQGGVIRLEKDKVFSLCVHLMDKYKYPPTDNVIAMKLLIEGDETKFNKVANSTTISNEQNRIRYRKKLEELRMVA